MTSSILISVLALGFAAPALAQVRHEFTQLHMGMPVRIVVHAPADSIARAAARAAFRRIAELDNSFSDYRATSELRQLEQRAGQWVAVSQPLFAVIARALEIARLTEGAFDPTIAPVSALWRAARQNERLPLETALDSARQLVGWHRVELDSAGCNVRLQRAGVRLDLGGIAKGYILQDALRTLERHGIAAAMLEAGGDVVVSAAPPGRSGWTIQTPGADHNFAARAASLTHSALATSGAASQHLDAAGVRYSHVIDPGTAHAVTAARISYVIAADAATADALATALSVLGPDAVARLRERFPDAHIAIPQLKTCSNADCK